MKFYRAKIAGKRFRIDNYMQTIAGELFTAKFECNL